MTALHTTLIQKRLILFLLLLLCCCPAFASHIVGGKCTYKYQGRSGALYNYEVSLTIYEDCTNPLPGAIEGDDPAYLAVFDTHFHQLRIDSVHYQSSVSVPANFNNACLSNPPVLCLIKKTFVMEYSLPASSTGYIISYQRCCRNRTIVNIVDPGNTGSTYYCNIPPTTLINTSAVFKNYPPQIICLNNPLFYDNSASDADGDSLSYEFCNALVGGEDHPSDPTPSAPPYDSVTWLTPIYYYTHPLTGYPPIQIDPVTGLITGTPNKKGRFLVTICCHEWRHGIIINTVKREFQFVVTDCARAVVASIPQFSTDPNTYIVDCTDYTVHFVNLSTGGITYHWDFGTGATSAEFEPTYAYPDTGTYKAKLLVNPGTTCTDSMFRLVKIYPYFHSAFAYTGTQCPGQPIKFDDLSSSTIKPIVYWKWNFGDGDTSFLQAPTHAYQYGGTYNVVLISHNIRDCTDTAVRPVIIETFKPFAGDDTVIVKGEHILFNATGGIDYAWTPGTNLDNTDTYDPTGYYPDTGTFSYSVHVQSEFGCYGDDTINVTVVNNAEFFVPSAFSPNGDGRNDYFKPVAIGYRQLNFFRVFNRWGELVYLGRSLESGWDGNYNNAKADIGVYYWDISFTDRFGSTGYLKGDVTLLR